MSIIQELSKALSIMDIDFRVQSINKGGYATILAYKDARVDMNRLDQVCGSNWQKDYKLIDGKLFCGIGIKSDNEWIWRWDVGTESNTEKEKGQASDSFKRAGFCWGIGRELYNYPIIQIKLNPDELTEYQGKIRPSFNFKLREWKWSVKLDDGVVKVLDAMDNNGNLRFNYKKGKVATPKKNMPSTMPWLHENPKAYKEVEMFIKDGKLTDLNNITKFRITQDTRNLLTKLIQG